MLISAACPTPQTAIIGRFANCLRTATVVRPLARLPHYVPTYSPRPVTAGYSLDRRVSWAGLLRQYGYTLLSAFRNSALGKLANLFTSCDQRIVASYDLNSCLTIMVLDDLVTNHRAIGLFEFLNGEWSGLINNNDHLNLLDCSSVRLVQHRRRPIIGRFAKQHLDSHNQSGGMHRHHSWCDDVGSNHDHIHSIHQQTTPASLLLCHVTGDEPMLDSDPFWMAYIAVALLHIYNPLYPPGLLISAVCPTPQTNEIALIGFANQVCILRSRSNVQEQIRS